MQRLQAVLLLCLACCWPGLAGALTLTPEERAWLAEHPSIRLGVDTSWPPFEFRDEQGRYQGLAAGYVSLLQERLGVSLTPVEPKTWTQVLEQAKDGRLDLLPGIMATPERQEYLSFTRPYLDFPIIILARKNGPMPKRIDELYGLKVAVVDHYAPHELLIAQHPDLTLLPLPSVAAALQALATSQADAFVGDFASSVWNLRQLKLNGLEISGETPYRYQLAMAVPRGQPILAGIVDKVLADLSAEEIEATPGPLGRRPARPTSGLARDGDLRPSHRPADPGLGRHTAGHEPPPAPRGESPAAIGARTARQRTALPGTGGKPECHRLGNAPRGEPLHLRLAPRRTPARLSPRRMAAAGLLAADPAPHGRRVRHPLLHERKPGRTRPQLRLPDALPPTAG